VSRLTIERRNPPSGCVHHSDRGSQYAAERYRETLAARGLVGSMGRRGNPYDNAKSERFMKTMDVEAVYPMEYESFEDVIEDRGLQQAVFYGTTGSRTASSKTTTLIIDAACDAWQRLTDQPETITSIGMRDWAHIGQAS
jgi:transposase InsO family protein